MSASTQTRRLVTPSTAKVLMRAITAQNAFSTWSRRTSPSSRSTSTPTASKRSSSCHGRSDGSREPERGDPADLRLLGVVQALERLARAEPARLDLAEHERAPVGEHEVELAPARVVVLGQHAIAEPREVLRGEALAEAAEVLAVSGLHARGR